MKVEIKKDGTLLIQAETELESYAIRKWLDDHPISMDGLTLSWGIPDDQKEPE